jgi:uncharacterized protein with LGFP repeats
VPGWFTTSVRLVLALSLVVISAGTQALAVGVGEWPDGWVDGTFVDCYNRNGGASYVGSPYDNGGGPYVHWWGDGVVQDFNGGAGGGGAILRKNGFATAYFVHGGIWAKYLGLGGVGFAGLGWPISDERDSYPSAVTGATARNNGFEGGSINYHTSGAHAGESYGVHGGIFAKYQAMGYSSSPLGLPISDERDSYPSAVTGATARNNGFEGGSINYHTSGAHAGESYEVHGGIFAKYRAMGYSSSVLGLPISDEREGYPSAVTGATCRYNLFEGGPITYHSSGAHAGEAYEVHGGIAAKWGAMGCGSSALGLPISDEGEAYQSAVTGATARYNRFEGGAINYHSSGAHAGESYEVHGGIFAKYQAMGYSSSPLGLPITDEFDATPSPYGTTGRFNRFEGGSLYLNYVSGEAHPVCGSINAQYDAQNGTGGSLGFPTSDPYAWNGTTRQDFEGGYLLGAEAGVGVGEWPDGWVDGTFVDCYNRNGGASYVGSPYDNGGGPYVHWWGDGVVQDFNGGAGGGGAILRKNGFATAYFVHGGIWAKYLGLGGVGFAGLGWPISDEGEAYQSVVTGATARYNRFEGGTINYHSSGAHAGESYEVHGVIFAKYQAMGYSSSMLGLPTSDEFAAATSPYGTTGRLSRFEGGAIYYCGPWGAHPVYGELGAQYEADGGTGGKWGFPKSDPYASNGVACQEFEGGTIGGTATPEGPYPDQDEWQSTAWYRHIGQLHAHYMPDAMPGSDYYYSKDGEVTGYAAGRFIGQKGLLDLYAAKGYDFVAITEHQPDWHFDDYTTLHIFDDAGTSGEMVSMTGSAEDTAENHILAVGFGTDTDLATMGSGHTVDDRLSNIRDNGGLAFFSHPDFADYPVDPYTLYRLRSQYNGFELYNTEVYAAAWLKGGAWERAALDQAYAVDTWDYLLQLDVRNVWGIAGDDFAPNYFIGKAWMDDASVVAWTPSEAPDKDQIKDSLQSGRFYACKGGSHAPIIMAYWADPASQTVSVQVPQERADERHYRVTFVRGRNSRAPEDKPLVARGDSSYVASCSYNKDDNYIRTEVRDDQDNTSWLQPIWVDRIQTKTGVLPTGSSGLRAAEAGWVLSMEDAQLAVSTPQTSVTEVTGTLLNGAERPSAPPMGYLSLCYEFTPEASLQGQNYLTIQYFRDAVRGFPESSLAIYRYNPSSDTWVALDGMVDTTTGSVTVQIDRLGLFAVSAEPPNDAGAPAIRVESPAAGTTVTAATPVTAQASDDQGVATVRFYLDGWPISADKWGGDGWSAVLDPANYMSGAKTLTAVAEDGVGNRTAAGVQVTVTGLMPPPTMAITAPATGQVMWGDLNASGTWSGQLPMTLGVYALDDKPLTATLPTDGPWGIRVPILPDQAGLHTLRATGFDIYGNRAETAVSLILNVFADIALDFWARGHIYAIARASISRGYPDGTYRPALPIARDQMAVYIARAMAGGDANVPTGPETASFADVPAEHWAYRYVEYAVSHGVVQGYDPTHYRPDEAVDRGQMAVYVARARGWVKIGDDMTTAPELFPDVPAGFWAGTAIQACVDNGVVHGYDDGYYRPEWQVTRDQMAVYVARAFGLGM